MWELVAALLSPAGGVSLGAGTVGLMLVVALPLRGGGQHSGSGPGALNVWQLREAVAAAVPDPAEADPPPEEIVWPPHDPGADDAAEPGYVGRHRLVEPDEYEYVGRHRLFEPLDRACEDLALLPP